MDSRYPRPRKRFGQNFLHDGSVLDRIAAALELAADSAVLEIGPGRGALTARLLEVADRVVAVELDRDLVRILRESFDPGRLEVVEGDVLEFDFGVATRWKVAGNLPYNISKPIAMRLVENVGSIDRAVLMFQREVARRLVAPTGTAEYGPLSVLPRAVFEIRCLFDVAPGSFRPRPGVTSTVTRWVARTTRPDEAQLRRLRATLKAVFAARRKTLTNNVRRALGSVEVLERAGVDGSRRAQELSPEELHALAACWPQ
jgi:16S rRNA (adenine1518-N6/adenine1519-N6)-dimethyltransferase